MEAVSIEAAQPSNPRDVEENRDLAALSYAWIMAPILLVVKRSSPFVHFHAKQGVILFVLSMLFVLVPYANRVLEIGIFLLMFWGFLDAAAGKWTELPIAGSLARGKLSLRGSWRQIVRAILAGRHAVAELWTKHDVPAVNVPVHQDIPPLDPDRKL
jgi:uncharacterized membrane protein